MTRYFTQYWTNDTWKQEHNLPFPNQVLNHAACNSYSERGLKIGDWVFILTILKGKLFLGGKIRVDKLCSLIEAAEFFNCEPAELWDAEEHIIDEVTNLGICSVEVPLNLTRELTFLGDNPYLKFRTDNFLDPQTLRPIRELSEESAFKLSSLLEVGTKYSREQVDEDSFDDNKQKVKRNPPWKRDELILALDLYFRHPPKTISQSHPEIIALSEVLNCLPIHAERPDQAKFRNPNGVYMKLCNFLRLDPSYKGKGLESGGKLEEIIWLEFSGDREELSNLATLIKSSISIKSSLIGIETEEENFPEGKIVFREHRRRERSSKLVKKAKQARKAKEGYLSCEICTFDYQKFYGELGEDYIECHHTKPVSQLRPDDTTSIKDLALVCANCHRMLHRKRPWLHPVDLKDIISSKRQ